VIISKDYYHPHGKRERWNGYSCYLGQLLIHCSTAIKVDLNRAFTDELSPHPDYHSHTHTLGNTWYSRENLVPA